MNAMQAPYADPNSYASWLYPQVTQTPAPAQTPAPGQGPAPLPAAVMQALASMQQQPRGPQFAPAAAAGNQTRQVSMSPMPGQMHPAQRLMSLAAILGGR